MFAISFSANVQMYQVAVKQHTKNKINTKILDEHLENILLKIFLMLMNLVFKKQAFSVFSLKNFIFFFN